ncbi:MAG: hypothetical protein FWC26_04535 [Fibromonadales bacterium]|nr:hypothetical protein [Fibromonadales bacterium]
MDTNPNPWKDLDYEAEKDKYVLNDKSGLDNLKKILDDKKVVKREKLEKKYSGKKLEEELGKLDDYDLRLKLYPEPFIGNPDAPIYLLNLNPGYDEINKTEHKENEKLIECIKENNSQKPMTYPFYWLDPALEGTSGSKYWKEGRLQKTKKIAKSGKYVLQTIPPRLGDLLEEIDHIKLSKKIFCVEYFPYHSKNYNVNKKIILPTQEYNRYLIEQAIEKTLNKATPENEKKIFIIMRKKTELFKLFGDLETLQKENRVFICGSNGNPCITKNNLKDGWKRIIKKITE